MRRGGSGHSIVELITALGLLSVLFALLGGLLGNATTLRDYTVEIGSLRSREARVRAAVERTLRGGWPIRSLSLVRTPAAELLGLRERDGGRGLLRRWDTGSALVCRTPEGYRVLSVEGGSLYDTALPAGGGARRALVAGGIGPARFHVERDGAGTMVGVRYSLTVGSRLRAPRDQPLIEGFVAFRLGQRPAPTKVRTVAWGGLR